jgi:hypothetical protein
MEQLMEREIAEAIATLNKANRALDRLFGTQEGEKEQCTRCESMVEAGELITLGDWKLCEVCEGDI